MPRRLPLPLLVFALLLGCSTGPATRVAPAIMEQPASLTVRSGDLAGLQVTAGGNPAPTLHWERSGDGGRSWSAVAGAVTPRRELPVTFPDDGALFRAVAVNALGRSVSAPARLTVLPRVFAAGVSADGTGIVRPGLWVDGVWSQLEAPSAADDATIRALVVR